MKVKLSDYIIDSLSNLGITHVFLVSGGGGMFLLDSLGRHKKLKYVCNHHEQASIMSAEGYQRATNNIGAAIVTTGPASTNALTGILCAWNDSIPIIVISGQANSKKLIGETGLRQRGVHEVDIVKIVKSVTKYAVTIFDETQIKYEFEKAIYLATNGRPGPVWIDIPIDIQSKLVDVDNLKSFIKEKESEKFDFDFEQIENLKKILENAKRPIVIAGHGIRLSNQMDEFFRFIDKYQIPVVTTKNGMDIMYDEHPLLAGRIGTYGQRAGNFAIQNADFVLSLGSRLSYPTTGYEVDLFAREAKVIVVDIDKILLDNCNVDAEQKIHADLKVFFKLEKLVDIDYKTPSVWRTQCADWRIKYPAVTKAMKSIAEHVNSYYFFDAISDYMSKKDYLVTDQGATFYSYTVAFRSKEGQRAFTNGGFSPMGYGLPAAVGMSCAKNIDRIVCVHGDGGLMMNLQELETIKFNKLPIILFVFNNDGYLSIKHTQNSYFDGFYVGSNPESGVSMPKWENIAKTFEMPYFLIKNHNDMDNKLSQIFMYNGPILVEVLLDPFQPYEPKVATTKKFNGKLVSNPLEDMSPLLDRDEFYSQMIVKPIQK